MAPDFKSIKLGGVVELEREVADAKRGAAEANQGVSDAKQKVNDLEAQVKVIASNISTANSATHLNLYLSPNADVGASLESIEKKVGKRDTP